VIKFVDRRNRTSKTFQDDFRCTFRGAAGIFAFSSLMKASSCLTGIYLGSALVKPKTCFENFILNRPSRSTELENHR